MKVIQAGQLIDGNGGEPVRNVSLVIDGNCILKIARAGDLEIPQEAEIVDASRQTVLPGLIDAHVHLAAYSLAEPTDFWMWVIRTPDTLKALWAAYNARRTLEGGVTTVRNICSGEGISLKQAIELGIAVGPRILSSAGVIAQTGGHQDTYLGPHWTRTPSWLADGIDGVRRATRACIRAGADFIKTCTSGGLGLGGRDSPEFRNYTVGEIEAITDEAHACGLKVAAHAAGTRGIKNALLGGVDTIEHGVYIDDEAAEMLAERNAFLVPTLTFTFRRIHGPIPGVFSPAGGDYKKMYADHQASVARAHRAGVKIVMGTDAARAVHGENAIELELLTQAGLTPMEAILAGTKNASEACGLQDKIGTLEPGKLADLLVLDGDPLSDISVLRNREKLALIMKNGEIVARK